MHDSHDEDRDKMNSNGSDQAQSNVTIQPPADKPDAQPESCLPAQAQHSVPQNPFLIEMCAGSARVTACLQQLGMPASFGVDHVKQKNSGKVLVADLTTDNGQTLFWTWLTAPNCAGIFAAPPCGTCSRARGIPVKLPNGVLIPGPQPLRSDNQPNGVAHMSYINKRRVSQANALYHFVTVVALYCLDHGLIVCIENPRSSLYWRTTFFAPLARLLHFTAHQACAYGSSRPKWTALAHNTSSLLKLNQTCPGVSPMHFHKPWGVVSTGADRKYSTAEETAYPMQLAYHIAFHIALELMAKAWSPPSDSLVPPDEVSYQYLRAIVGVQPKSSKIPPLVSEFHNILHISVPVSCALPVSPGEKLPQAWMQVPAGSCLLKKLPLRSSGGEIDKNSDKMADEKTHKDLFFGVYRTCDQFVKSACAAGHPAGKEARLPHALQDAVAFVSNNTRYDLAKHRLDTLKYWLNRGRALAQSEEALHASLHQSVRDILAPKRLLLWKEMLTHYGYPDMAVFEEVISGISLSGPVPVVQWFEPSFKPAQITEKELALSARASRIALLASVRSSGDDEVDKEVYSKTLDEVKCGWLEGPIPASSLDDHAVVSRRFGIRQSSGDSSKIRLIDDFTASNVNQTVQVTNAPKLHTLDVVAVLCVELLKASGDSQWVGKTVDLSSAYRQLGVAPGSQWVSYIAVYDPEGKEPKVFSMKALPFGASKSVYGFLRVAHSLWWLGCVSMKFLWSNFFDDFVTLSRRAEADTMQIATSQFFRLLGWMVSSGDKDLPFACSFKALGIEIDLSTWDKGVVLFRNTQKRIKELCTTIDTALETGVLSSPDALALRGRMQFAKSQIWGRSAKLCLAAVTAHAYSNGGDSLSEHAKICLRSFRDSLAAARPREISASWDRPFLLFTDASFNPEDEAWPCGLGGVLVDSDGTQVAALSCSLCLSDLVTLGYPEKSTVIFEAELLALVLCVKVWRKIIKHRPCIMYVDNNSTRDVAISGCARTFPGSALVALLLHMEDSACVTAWYSRVPSSSNPADAPSRNSLEGINVGLTAMQLVRLHLDKIIGELLKVDDVQDLPMKNG